MPRSVWIALAALSLAPTGARAVPPAFCVDPIGDARARLAPEPPSELARKRLPDLDADGRRDVLVWDGGTCGSGGCDFHAYLTNHGCPRWSGWLRGREVTALRTRHAGIRDLTATETGGAFSWTQSVAEHDGELYRVRARDCDQRDGDDAPRCGAWAARGVGSAPYAADDARSAPPVRSPDPRSWETGFDFDGDGVADEIEVRFTGGAHCCYELTLALGTGARFTLPFLLDGGYVGGLDLSQPDRFSIGDHDGDGRPDLRAWIGTYNDEDVPLSRALRRRGIRTHHILVDVVRGRPRYRRAMGTGEELNLSPLPVGPTRARLGSSHANDGSVHHVRVGPAEVRPLAGPGEGPLEGLAGRDEPTVPKRRCGLGRPLGHRVLDGIVVRPAHRRPLPDLDEAGPERQVLDVDVDDSVPAGLLFDRPAAACVDVRSLLVEIRHEQAAIVHARGQLGSKRSAADRGLHRDRVDVVLGRLVDGPHTLGAAGELDPEGDAATRSGIELGDLHRARGHSLAGFERE